MSGRPAPAGRVAAVISGLAVLAGCHAAPLYSSAAHLAVPAGHTCSRPRVVPMDPRNPQSGISEGAYYVTNDTWNAAHYGGLSQSIYVCDYDNWYTIATMNNDTADGAVKTSPNVQESWYPEPTPLRGWKSITSRYSDVPPGEGRDYGIWEFEYDIWLNGLADSASTEIMIWTYDNGQAPRGALSGSFTEGGHTYKVYYSAAPYEYIAFVDQDGKLSGDLNLTDFFRFAIAKGWLSGAATLYQICNGVELVSTNGRPEKFDVNNFGVSMQAAG